MDHITKDRYGKYEQKSENRRGFIPVELICNERKISSSIA